jgi:hypothetical protein
MQSCCSELTAAPFRPHKIGNCSFKAATVGPVVSQSPLKTDHRLNIIFVWRIMSIVQLYFWLVFAINCKGCHSFSMTAVKLRENLNPNERVPSNYFSTTSQAGGWIWRQVLNWELVGYRNLTDKSIALLIKQIKFRTKRGTSSFKSSRTNAMC